jgi:hypothetical protein
MRKLSAPVVLTLGMLILASGCGGQGAPVTTSAPLGTLIPTATPALAPAAVPMPPTPMSTATGTPIWEDKLFREQSLHKCDAARPVNLYEILGPTRPQDKAPEFAKVHIVIVEMRNLDGSVRLAPETPAGRPYYYPLDDTSSGVQARFAEDVDLLACLALRAADSRVYSGWAQVTVLAMDVITWMVDAQTGALIGRPWVVGAALSPSLLGENLIPLGGDLMMLLPYGDEVGRGILSFLGLVRPSAGGFQSFVGDQRTKSCRRAQV